MTYTALYRRYRPQTFGGLIGQPHIAKVLAAAVQRGNFSHAYLFCGPRGTGKTSAARILARAINCVSPVGAGDPCGLCAACQRDLSSESMDVIEVDGASNRGIDEIRDLRERVKYAPAQEKYKIYIIDEVHMLTNDAFNALLKTLEEPPAHVVFILATTAPHKVLPTVLSRCQRFDFRRISEEEIAQHLQEIAAQEVIPLTEEAAKLIARKAEGGMRDAISLLDQCACISEGEITPAAVAALLGACDRDFILGLLAQILAGDITSTLQQVETLVTEGKDLRQALDDLLEATRDVLLGLLAKERPALPDWAQQYPPAAYLTILQQLSDTDGKMRYALSPRITLELALIKSCGLGTAAAASTVAGTGATAEAAPDAPTAPARQSRLSSAPSEPGAEAKVKTTAKAEAPAKTTRAAKGEQAAATKQSRSAAEQAPAAPTVTLDAVVAKWPAILSRVEQKNAGAYVWLQDAIPARLEGSRLYLDFPPADKDGMQAILSPAGYRATVETAIAQELRLSLQLEGFLGAERELILETEQIEPAPAAADAPPATLEQGSIF